MAWNNTAVTTAGNALLQRVLAGEQLSLDYAAGGTGTVDVASLMAQASLYEQKQQFNIIGVSKVTNGQKVNIQVLNTGLAVSYKMQQIGIWAHIGSDAPVLFALLQDENGIDIPSATDVADFALNFYAVIDFNNQSSFQIIVDSSALVTYSMLVSEINSAFASKLPFKEDETYLGCFYREENGVKEWLNPPMANKTIYRTVERFWGSTAVYTCLFDCQMNGIKNGATEFLVNLPVDALILEVSGIIYDVDNQPLLFDSSLLSLSIDTSSGLCKIYLTNNTDDYLYPIIKIKYYSV